MKKNIFSLLVLLTAFIVSCGDSKIAASEVPAAALQAFNSKYQGATDVKWEKEKKSGKTIYEAEFKFNGARLEAEFDADGSFIAEE
jgi:hypothetical protein